MAYKVGTTIWHAGDEVTISTEPYELFGGTWQDAIVIESGARVTVRDTDEVAARVERQKAGWHEMQAGFRRIREAQAGPY